MIIDFHTHVFPEKVAEGAISELERKSGMTAAVNGSVDGLLGSMNGAGIDCSVIMPVVTAPKQFAGINSFAQAINDAYQQKSAEKLPRLISFGGIHPDSEDYQEQLKTLKTMGFAGIKLHPDYQGVNFDDIRYKRIVGLASEMDMTVLVHAGVDIGLPEQVRCTPTMAVNVLKETQANKLILAHLGGWKLWDEVEELLVGREVYFDTAFIQQHIDREQFCRIVREHGSEKILFATDSPWTEQKFAVDWLKECELTSIDKENIFWKNAVRLLGREMPTE